MAESQSLMAEYKRELDEMLAGVMPDHWEGHGRLKIAERDFSPKQHTFAHKLLGRLSEKHPDYDSEKLADKAIEMTEEKL